MAPEDSGGSLPQPSPRGLATVRQYNIQWPHEKRIGEVEDSRDRLEELEQPNTGLCLVLEL